MGLMFNKTLVKFFLAIFAAVTLLAVPFNKDLVFGYGSTLGVTTTQTAPIDLTSGIINAAGGNLGAQPLNSYDGGNLSNVDLTNLGVSQGVTLSASAPGSSITINNSSLSNVSIVIPDNTTILAPASWDGFLTPPVTGTNTGSAPSGFSVGNTAVEVGSSLATLLFDQPVDVVLAGVTGPVGYRPAGSSAWVRITNACGGTYANPASPAFPLECYITNGTDTKIHTWHLTTFASLVAVTASGISGSSSGSGDSSGGGGGAPGCNDAAAGGAPVLLSAKSSGPNKVILTWSKAKDPVTHYVISYGLNPGKPLYGNPNAGGKDTTSYTVGSLSGNTTYYFRVRAGNGCNGGPYSSEVAVRPTGGFISTPAAGFAAGVLGTTKTVGTPAAEKQPGLTQQPVQSTPGSFQQANVTESGGLLGNFFRFIFGFFSKIFGR